MKHTLRVSIFYCYTKILQVPVLTKRWTVIAAVKKTAIKNRKYPILSFYTNLS